MPDLNQPDIANKAAQAAIAPEFDSLVRRARRRRRTAIIGTGLAVAAVATGVFSVVGATRDTTAPVVPAPSTQRVTSPSLTPPTTPTPSKQTVPVSGPCPLTSLRQLPKGSGCASLAHGDFDGDGLRDTLFVYANPLDSEAIAEKWHVRLALASGAVKNSTLPLPRDGSNLEVVGAANPDRNARDDAFIVLHRGASDDFIGIFSVVGERLTQLRGPDGRPFEIDHGGSVLFGSGLLCPAPHARPELVTTGFGFDHQGAWLWQRTIFSWQGWRLVQVTQEHGTTTARKAEAYRRFDCLGLTLSS